MIMAAGTGGHIFPGLAIAQTMRARGWEVSWLGTTHGMEQELVPKSGIPMDAIAFSGMRGKGLAHTVKGGFKMIASLFAIRGFIARRKPDVVMGMGGYVTVPGGLVARLSGVPLVLVNADAALLLSNKTLVPLAQQVCFGFPADFGAPPARPSSPAIPVRAEILAMAPPAARFEDRSGPLAHPGGGRQPGRESAERQSAGRAGLDAGRRTSAGDAPVGQEEYRRPARRVCGRRA